MHHNWPCPDNRSCFFNTLLNSSNPVSKHSSSGKELWSQFVTHKIKMVSPKRREFHGCCWSLGHIYVLHQWPSAGPMCKHDQPKTKEFVLNLWGLPKRLVSLVKCEEESRMSPPSAQPPLLQSHPSTWPPTCPSPPPPEASSMENLYLVFQNCLVIAVVCLLLLHQDSLWNRIGNPCNAFFLTYKSSVLVPILVA